MAKKDPVQKLLNEGKEDQATQQKDLESLLARKKKPSGPAPAPSKKLTKANVKTWFKRISGGEKAYKTWVTEYQPQILLDYWKGAQWQGHTNWRALTTHNLFWSTINSKIPSLMFSTPTIQVKSRPGRNDDLGGMVDERANLIKDTLNCKMQDPRLEFERTIQLTIQEAMSYYGIIEVGFESDYVDNPRAGRPLMAESGKELDVVEPDKIVRAESLFIKRIPATQWRVSGRNTNDTDLCDWCGYFEFQPLGDVRRNPNYTVSDPLKIKEAARDVEDEGGDTVNTYKALPDSVDENKGMAKLWKIWDLRAMKQYVFSEGCDEVLREKDYDVLPVADLRLFEIANKWYPIPPTFQWKSLQDAYNQCQEMARIHRERAKRIYLADPNADHEEAGKLSTCDDKSVLYIGPNQLAPLQDAPLSQEVFRDGEKIKADFREISGGSGEFNGVAEADTATQAGILATGQRIRDSRDRQIVARWLAKIAYLVFVNLKKLALPFWVETNVDLPALRSAIRSNNQVAAIKEMAEIVRVKRIWQQIESEDLEDIEVDITIAVESLSPVALQQEQAQWNGALLAISTPATMALFANSELLLKKTLRYYGITAEAEIQEIQKALQVASQAVAQNNLPGPGAANAAAIAAQPGAQGQQVGGSAATIPNQSIDVGGQ